MKIYEELPIIRNIFFRYCEEKVIPINQNEDSQYQSKRIKMGKRIRFQKLRDLNQRS